MSKVLTPWIGILFAWGPFLASGHAQGIDDTPDRDPTYVTGLNANRIVREALVGMAMRKRGLVEPHYLNPLTVDDGQD